MELTSTLVFGLVIGSTIVQALGIINRRYFESHYPKRASTDVSLDTDSWTGHGFGNLDQPMEQGHNYENIWDNRFWTTTNTYTGSIPPQSIGNNKITETLYYHPESTLIFNGQNIPESQAAKSVSNGYWMSNTHPDKESVFNPSNQDFYFRNINTEPMQQQWYNQRWTPDMFSSTSEDHIILREVDRVLDSLTRSGDDGLFDPTNFLGRLEKRGRKSMDKKKASSQINTPVMNRRKNLRKARVSLFQDDGMFDEFSPLTIFTPGKCVPANDSYADNITPVIKREVSPLTMDEDSGLGMDDDIYIQIEKGNGLKEEKKENDTNLSQSRLVDTPSDTYSFAQLKRPLDMIFKDNSSSIHKRQRKVPKRRISRPLTKALSFGDEPINIDTAIEHVLGRVGDESDLVSDGSRTYRLPTVRGKHQDLKCISPETMADILTGKYSGVINSYKIVDCRYPYEYDGGHIQGAENRYTKESVLELLNSNVLGKKPDVLIFHCEFSSERGPKMSRFLRNKDREINSDNYPALHYPEIYLLSGGYKDFFYMFKNLCEPQEYKPMLHNDHSHDLRHFRAKSKSWTADEHRRTRKSNRLLF